MSESSSKEPNKSDYRSPMEEQILPILWPRLIDKIVHRKQRLQSHDRLSYDSFLRVRSVWNSFKPQPAAPHIEEYDGKVWTCPLSQEKYQKTCPVESCPANISKTGGESGCIYNYLNKTEISIYDYAFANQITVKAAKARLTEGEDQIQFVFFCKEILSRVRERNIRQIVCPNCGVFRSTKGPCLNIVQCKTRVALTNKVLKTSPLNVPESPMTRQDVFSLMRAETEIVKLMEARNTELPTAKPRHFHDLLGVDPEFMNRHREIRTLV